MQAILQKARDVRERAEDTTRQNSCNAKIAAGGHVFPIRIELQVIAVVGQFELTRYLPETSAMKSATKRWISAGGTL